MHAFRGLIRFHDSRILQEKLEFLRSIPLFTNFSRSSLLTVLKKSNLLKFSRYQPLFKEGQVSKHLFLIKAGEFKVQKQLVFRKDQDGRQGSQRGQPSNPLQDRIVLAHIGKNRSCGEEDALEGKVHQNSAICHSSTAEVLAIES